MEGYEEYEFNNDGDFEIETQEQEQTQAKNKFVNHNDFEYSNQLQQLDITKNGEKTFVNGSEIVGSIKASNGVIHIIGDVLLPK